MPELLPILHRYRRWLIGIMVMGVCGILFVALHYFGILWYPALFAARYPVKGLDVSHHQHAIDWSKVAATNKYSFVFIKATEGHDFFDDRFQTNWREAKAAGLAVGAYHFFSMRSPGLEQAEYYGEVVPVEADSLAPVIDIEIHTQHDPTKVRTELRAMSDALTTRYQTRPILYVTYDTYDTYVSGHFDDHRIWIRDVTRPPRLTNDQWLIWQYNFRGHVPGIPTYVDINAVQGTVEDLR